MIRSLELKGFKSFANKTVVQFKEGLNVIVGPNGSGKSNIVDAICFVLGKTRKKEMRTAKLSHLIFNGGKNGKPMDLAKVVITLLINGRERRISRVVNKDGNSIFRIDGRRSNLGEVIGLLKSANIDPEGFNIILQGEINKFVEMSPVQRRRIIDKISGVEEYEEKKEKALRELAEVEEKIKGKRIVLTEKEKYLEALLKDKKHAERYLKLKEELARTKAKISLKRLTETKKALEEVDKGIGRINEEQERLRKRMEELEGEKKRLEEEFEELEEELGKRGEEKERELREKVNSLSREVISLKEEVEGCDREIKRIGNRERQLESELEENERDVKEIERKLQTVRNRIKRLKESLKEVEKVDVGLKLVELEKDIEFLRERLREAEKREREVEVLKKELRELKEREEELYSKRSKLEKELLRLERKESEIEEYLDHLDKRLEEKRKSLKEVLGKMGKGTREILKMGKRGVIGQITSLFSVPKTYEKAIWALVGGRRNIIVVENEDVAIECIKYLKENKLGFATFLPLSRIKEREIKKVRGEGIISMAKDVVECEDKYEKVINWLFGDSVIIKDLSVAKKYDGLRMATLDGDLVEPSGLFRGGYRREVIGDEASLRKSIESLERERERYGEFLRKLSSERKEVDEELEGLKRNLWEVERGIVEREATLREKEVDSKEILGMRLRLGERERELERLKALRGEEKELEVLKNELSSLLVEEKSLLREKEMLEREAERLKSIMRGLTKEKKDFEKMGVEKREELKIKERELKKLKTEQEKFYKRLKGLYERRVTLKGRIERMERRLKELGWRIEKLEKEKQRRQIERAGILAKLEGLKKEFEEYGFEMKLVREGLHYLERRKKELERELERFGPVNLKALETYNEVKEEYEELLEKVERLEKEKEEILRTIEEVEKEKEKAFMSAFQRVKKSFLEIYKKLSGGEAKVSLDEEKPLEGGMDLLVKPPGRRFMPLRSLSGGEKTIVSLAFIFAIQEFCPAPFYLLDEIDAALDKLNSQKLAEILKEHSKKAQVIIISHNDEIVARADYLYGVSINRRGISNIVSIKL